MIVDAIAIPSWTRGNAEDMRAGGLTAVNVICAVWENFEDSCANIARLKAYIAENEDLLLQVHTLEDIRRAEETGRTGLIIGWQNTGGIPGDPRFVRFFHDLGLRVAQLTFNSANTAGSGCYESRDGGLTDYGRELVAAFNSAGVALDLSHLGLRTAEDVIEASERPVFYSHTNPAALCSHPRNRTDQEMRRVVEHGGVVALAALPHYLRNGERSSVEDFADAICYAVNVVGEEGVALGTDLTPGQGPDFYRYISLDQGHGRPLVSYGGVPPRLTGMESFRDYPSLRASLAARAVPESTVDRIFSGNLLRFFGDVWNM